MYGALLNYTLMQQNRGREEFNQHYLGILRHMDEQNLVADEENEINPARFRNAIGIAVYEGEMEWAQQFYDRYVNQVEKDRSEFAADYAQASLAYGRCDYSEAFARAQHAAPADISERMLIRKLLLKIHFNAGDWAFLEEQIHAFREFVNSNTKLHERKVKYMKSFMSTLSKMSRLRPADYDKWKKLKTQLEKQETVYDRKWIYRQIDRHLSKKAQLQ